MSFHRFERLARSVTNPLLAKDSQGATVDAAMENIRDAIEGYLELYGEPEARCEIREMEVVTG